MTSIRTLITVVSSRTSAQVISVILIVTLCSFAYFSNISSGIGGTSDSVAHLAKMATMRPLNQKHPNPDIANMERQILDAVNKTGIGVMGLGGDTTALGVNIDYASTHSYRTPLAFELNCWPGRRASANIYADGSVEYIGDD